MDLISVDPVFNLYNEAWPILTLPEPLPPAKFVFEEPGRTGMAVDSMVCAGVVVSGGVRPPFDPLPTRARPLVRGRRRLGAHARGRHRPRRRRQAGDPGQERARRRGGDDRCRPRGRPGAVHGFRRRAWSWSAKGRGLPPDAPALRVALLTREYPPDVYGGAGVHVEYLARELAGLVDVTVHCWGADRPASPAGRAESGRAPRLGRPRRRLAAPGRAAGRVDRPDDGGRRRGRLARPLPHLVRPARRAPRQADVRDPGRLHGALARADAAVEGGAARRRLRGLVLLRAHGARRRRCHRGRVVGDAARCAPCYPAVDPERVHVVYNGIDTDEYAPDAGTDVLERYGVDPARPSVVFVGRITRQKGLAYLCDAALEIDPAAQLVLCAGSPDTPEIARRDRGQGREVARRARRRGLARAHAREVRGDPAALARHRVRLPLDLRAARHRQPRGDGVRERPSSPRARAGSPRSSRTASRVCSSPSSRATTALASRWIRARSPRRSPSA